MDSSGRDETRLGICKLTSFRYMENYQICPICNGKSFRAYKFKLLLCEACRLVVSPAVWQKGANENMVDTWFGDLFLKKPSFWVRLFDTRTNNLTLSRLNTLHLPGIRLLEVGVGRGSFLNAAKMRGYEVMGCDLSKTICSYIEDLYNIPMHSGTLESLKGGGRFDVVVMNHVLEHLQNPIDVLKEVHRLLIPGGVVHIAVPNIDCWEACLPGWSGYEPYHLTYLNPLLLRRVCRAAGFSPINVETHETFSSWFLTLTRSMLGVNCEQDLIKRRAVYHAGLMCRPTWLEHSYRLAMVMVGVVSWPLRMVQAWLGFGDEVICVVQKSISALQEHTDTKNHGSCLMGVPS